MSGAAPRPPRTRARKPTQPRLWCPVCLRMVAGLPVEGRSLCPRCYRAGVTTALEETPRSGGETGVSGRIREWLEANGWRVFRHGAARVKAGRIVAGHERDNGLGDLLAYRAPYHLIVEVKGGRGRLEESQEDVEADPRVSPFLVRVKNLEALQAELRKRGLEGRS